MIKTYGLTPSHSPSARWSDRFDFISKFSVRKILPTANLCRASLTRLPLIS